MNKYIQGQVDNGKYYVEIHYQEEERKSHHLHFVAYNFLVSNTSTSTKVRMTMDSSMGTESDLSLNDITQPAPGDVPNFRRILTHSRCHLYYAIFNIKEFFRSVLINDKDSCLRIVCVPANLFSSPPTLKPTWRFFRNQAIPFGDNASGDYATCAKVATVQKFIKDSPPLLQPIILQAVLKDTNIDDRGVGAKSIAELFKVKQEIEPILDKGGLFYNQFLGTFQRKILSKYLGMAWDHL